MKVSEITVSDVKEYIRDTADDDAVVADIMASAKGFIASQTGLTVDEIDEIPEMSYAFKCLCADMYDERSAVALSDKLNPIVQTIIHAHRVNMIGGASE